MGGLATGQRGALLPRDTGTDSGLHGRRGCPRPGHRAAEAAEKQAWEAFVARAKAGKVAPEDRRYLRDVEDLAMGRSERSRVLKALAHEESYENAHATLLEFGFWDETINPYPSRYGLTLTPPSLPLPEPWDDPARAMLAEERRDLTHLPAFAIDDPWTDTPDDAVSYEPETGRLWVHVADAAALVAPDSPLDLEARARATSLYLPEAVVPMLPEAATPVLGLGLGEVSPALSFALTVNADGELTEVEVVPSLVHVSRLSYEEAEARLAEEPFRTIYALGLASEARRQRDGTLRVDMPEVSVQVRDGEVTIRTIPPLRSRDLVQCAMILAGEAAARVRHHTRHSLALRNAGAARLCRFRWRASQSLVGHVRPAAHLPGAASTAACPRPTAAWG